MSKSKTTQVATYMVSEGGAKYLKFGPKKDKNKNVVGTNPFPLVINEGDVLFINVFDEDFRNEKSIPDFIVGNVQKPNDEAKKNEDEEVF
jgi:hypothetical protein